MKYVQEGCGISYYRDHLSVMGLGENSSCYIDSLEEKHSVISSQSSTSDTPSISTNNSITLVNNTENINNSVNVNGVSSLANESPTLNAIVGSFQNNFILVLQNGPSEFRGIPAFRGTFVCVLFFIQTQ